MSVNRNIFYTFLTQIPTLILGVISGVFITRIIGASGKGVFATIQSDIELFTLVFSFSISSGIVYFVSSQKTELNKLLGICTFLYIGGLSLLALILVGFKLFFPDSFIFPPGYNQWFFVIYIFAAFAAGFFNAIASGIFQGKTLFTVVNKIVITNSILNLSLFSMAFAYHHFVNPISIRTIFVLTFIVLLTNSVLWFISYKKHIHVKPSFDFNFNTNVKPLLNFVLLDHTGQLINFLNYRLDIWIINNYLTDTKQLGYYNVAVTTAQIIWLVSTPIASVMIPHLTNNDREGKNKIFQFFSRFNFTVCLGLIAGAVLLAPVFIPLLYGDEFSNSVPSFLLLLIGVLFYSVNKLFAAYIYSCGKVQYNLIVALVGLLFTIVFDLILIPQKGITGAAIASSVSYVAMFIMTTLFLFAVVKLEFKNYFILNSSDIKHILAKGKNMLAGLKADSNN